MRQIVESSLVFVFLLMFLTTGVNANIVDRLIAVIDGEPYTLRYLGSYAKTKMNRSFPTGDLAAINDNDREVLEQFLTDKLLEAEVREAGIRIGTAQVDQYIEQIKSRNQLTDQDLTELLKHEGHTLESYRASVKSELEKHELIDRQVKRRVNITDEDVERYYQLNADKYRVDDRARLRHILLPLERSTTEEEAQRAMSKGRELYKRIRAGEDFAELARQFSQGAGYADGGDIGWVRRGTLLSSLEDVAFDKLALGQVSEPFRTSMGIHIVKVEARDKGSLVPLARVAPKIKEDLYGKIMEERFAKWVKTDLRRKHRVDVKIPGVEFKAEDSKEGTVDQLLARSTRLNRRQERSFLSYLNPFSYITSETPIEEADPTSPLYGKNVVSIFGVPLFTRDVIEEVPDVLSEPGPATR